MLKDAIDLRGQSAAVIGFYLLWLKGGNLCSLKFDSRHFRAVLLALMKAYTLLLKLLAGRLHSGFCSHLLTKNLCNKFCNQPGAARNSTTLQIKCGRVPL